MKRIRTYSTTEIRRYLSRENRKALARPVRVSPDIIVNALRAAVAGRN